MQNRYTGDIGDYGKLGLLRFLSDAGFSIGVNWYLVPNESHNNDGRHTGYLSDERFRGCDEALWLQLRQLVKTGQRRVSAIEDEDILKAAFYSKVLSYAGQVQSERRETRRNWHQRALARLAGSDIVFLDPDNGLLVPSAEGTPRDNKYVHLREIEDYWRQGSTVIYYQHKARKKDEFYIEKHRELLRRMGLDETAGCGLKFIPTSQRYYFFIIQPRHQSMMERRLERLMKSEWRRHFQRLDMSTTQMTDTDRSIPGGHLIMTGGSPMNEMKKAVISVLGTDKKGIIAQVSRILYENDANILDISQTIVSGLFSMILIADVSGGACSFDTLKTELDALSGRIGVQIRIQRSEIFEAMHQI